ncbi:transmembrane 7 superfamily member 3-like [Elysia marginata]|uniref:Transmembrane 7 superfamily member 3-like n=1 Tax=Elysia marginata TaxID=1093978 RepID=A0AAV4G2V1_9GAST|nr:transmembrane 7 superfamily member 3-like [Elysia marginata]
MYNLAGFVIRLWLVCCFWLCHQNYAESATYSFPVEKSHIAVLPANETTSIQTKGLSMKSSRFVVIQVHSQRKILFLSSNKDFDVDSTKTGKNVGLVTLLTVGQDKETWYIKANCTQNVTVSVIIQLYTDSDPIPGGCNQVFNLEQDPSVVIEHKRPYRSNVFFQWANLATRPGRKLPDCEDKEVLDNLEYEVYVSFMRQRDLGEDEFMRAVQQVLRPEDLKEHGTKIFSETDTPTSQSQVSVTSREGQGAVYSVLVRRKDTGHSATYTTAVSYACDIDGGGCDVSLSALRIAGAIFLGVVGLFLLLFGHRYFRASQVVFGFIFSGLLTYIVIFQAQTHDWVCLLLAVLVGVIGGGAWLAVWQRFNFPTAQVFLMGLCAGYVVAAVVFFTPFGNISWWTAPVNYALCYVCLVLIFSVAFMAFPKFLSIMSCCIVGSMMALWSVSIPLWASLEMIFLNSIYHQTQSSYSEVKVVYPLNMQDIVIYAFWPAIAILGMGLQFYREMGNAGFSKPFEILRSSVLRHHELPRPSSRGRNVYTYEDDAEDERHNVSESNSGSGLGGNSETSRLLSSGQSQTSAQQQPLYRSVHSRAQPSAPVNDSAKFNDVI